METMKRSFVMTLVFVALALSFDEFGASERLVPHWNAASTVVRTGEQHRPGDSESWSAETLAPPQPGSSPDDDAAPADEPENDALVVPAARTSVRAAASGTLRELAVGAGETISRGQTVARIRDDDVAAELKRQQAAVAVAKCRIREAEAELELARYAAGWRRVEVATARRDAATQELEVARCAVEMIERRLEKYEVVAPFSGRVTEVIAHPDQYVSEGDIILWIESTEKRLILHLPLDEVEGREPVEVSVLVAGEWRRIPGGVRQPRLNANGTVTVVFDLGQDDDFVCDQLLPVASGGSGR